MESGFRALGTQKQICGAGLLTQGATSKFFFKKHSINLDTYTHMSTHLYEYIYAHPIFMSIFERLSQLDLEIHEVDHQKCIAVDGDVASHCKNN
jgi:hypothetical protein